MIKLVIFDCDGVVYRGNRRLPHVRETFQALRKNSIPYRFVTNNSTLTRADYRAKLSAMGVKAELGEIMASAYASAVYLKAAARPGARVLPVGERGISLELKQFGFTLVSPDEWKSAEYVVAGMDRKFTYKKLAAAMSAILNGAKFIATNRDPTYPVEGGGEVPGGGSIVAAIETAVGRAGLLIGKPEPTMLLQVLEEAGVPAKQALFVGDRPSTDVVTGRRAGVKTLLTLAGITPAKDVPLLPREHRPDYVSADVRGVLDLLGIGAKGAAVAWKDFTPRAGKAK